jgi:hypothetical protein
LPELKLQVVLKSLRGVKTDAQICRVHQFASMVIAACKRQLFSADLTVLPLPRVEMANTNGFWRWRPCRGGSAG